MYRYLTKKTLAANHEVSISTVDRILRLIRDQRGVRYPQSAVEEGRRFVRIREDVFDDAIRNREMIEMGCAPEFREKEAAPLTR